MNFETKNDFRPGWNRPANPAEQNDPALAPIPAAPRTYTELRKRVTAALSKKHSHGERAPVLTYWQVGMLIDLFLLENPQPAYWKFITRLAAAAGVLPQLLGLCVDFARAYPRLPSRPPLKWSHYKVLTPVHAEATRRELEARAIKEHWSFARLSKEASALRRQEAAPDQRVRQRKTEPAVFRPKCGTVGLYRVVRLGTHLVVDLGFTAYLELSPAQAARFKPGDHVRIGTDDRIRPAPEASEVDLYTYHAEVLHVVDGDSFLMKIRLKPRYWLRERLRLRGVDCAGVNTASGRKAKQAVEELLRQAETITITTTMPDKWDRYLADVYVRLRTGGEVTLNEFLLENGLGVRKRKYRLADWSKGDTSSP